MQSRASTCCRMSRCIPLVASVGCVLVVLADFGYTLAIMSVHLLPYIKVYGVFMLKCGCGIPSSYYSTLRFYVLL